MEKKSGLLYFLKSKISAESGYVQQWDSIVETFLTTPSL